jgi:transcriptional regulator with XRE-family HTH domain
MYGESLRLIRTFHQVSQIDLANSLNISRSYLSEIESGKKNPSLDLLQRYSEFFDIPLSSIMFFAEQAGESHLEARARKFLNRKALDILRWVEDKANIDRAA